MTRSKNTLKLNSSLDQYYFDNFFEKYDCFNLDYIFAINITLFAHAITKMISMPKFDSSSYVKQWLCILKTSYLNNSFLILGSNMEMLD